MSVAPWVACLSLTIALILYPASLRYGGTAVPVETTGMFSNLRLFAVLFYLWLAALLTLLLTGASPRGRFVRSLIVVNLFALIFRGLWILLTPYGSGFDSVANLGIVRSIVETGILIRGHPNLGYTDYPGLHMFAASVSMVTGLTVFQTGMVLRLVNAQVVATLVFLCFARLTGSQLLGVVGALLFFENIPSNVSTLPGSATFFPSPFALTLLFALVLVLMTERTMSAPGSGSSSRLVPSLLILAAATITHFPTPAAMFLLLFSSYVVMRVCKRGARRELLQPTPVIWYSLVLFLAWELYGTTHTFPELVIGSRHWLSFSFVSVAWRNGVTGLPPWAATTRLVWLAIVCGVIVFGAYQTVRVRRLATWEERLCVTGFIGVGILAVGGGVMSPDGSQAIRLMYLSPIFAYPLLLIAIRRVPSRLRATVALPCGLLLGALSFPSFLISDTYVTTTSTYPHDVAAGEFVHMLYGNGDDLAVHGVASGITDQVYVYHVRNASISAAVAEISSKAEFFDRLSRKFTLVASPDDGRRSEVYVFDSRTVTYMEKVGVPSDDPGWGRIRARLARLRKFYDNGPVQLYQPDRSEGAAPGS